MEFRTIILIKIEGREHQKILGALCPVDGRSRALGSLLSGDLSSRELSDCIMPGIETPSRIAL